MNYYTETLKLKTTDSIQFIDITEMVMAAFNRSEIKDGLVNIFTEHTTTAIKVNERCDRLQKDMVRCLRTLIPVNGDYAHNYGTVDGRGNAHSHLMSMLMNSSETIPAANGILKLGRWQSIFFMELDGPRGERRATVNIIGE